MKSFKCSVLSVQWGTVLLLLCMGVATQAQRLRTVDTIHALLQQPVTINETNAIVRGTLAAGDGGAGQLFWDASDTTATNAGTIYKATGVATGRWLRPVSGPLNPLWFGAKPDGVTTNTTALQAMIYEAERTTNAIHFPSTRLPFATGNLWITNGNTLKISGDNTQMKLVHDPSSVIDYGAGPGYAVKAVFLVVGATNRATQGLISGFHFTAAAGITNITGQTSGTVYGVALVTSDNWLLTGNTFEMTGAQGVGNGGSANILVHANTFKDCGLQSGVGYRNSFVYGGTNSNQYAMTNFLARGCQGYSIQNNSFSGATDRRFVFLSAAPDFILSNNRFLNVVAGNTNVVFGNTNTFVPVIQAYVGDVGWADNNGIFQTNYAGVIRDNIINFTGEDGISVRGDEQQSSITTIPAGNQINVDYLQTRIKVVGNTLRSTSTNGVGISLYTARKALILENDVIVKSSPLRLFGDCTGTIVRGGHLESVAGGQNQGSTLWLSTASGNTGKTTDLLFDGVTVVSSAADEWFLRSAAAYGSDLRDATFRGCKFVFTGAGNSDFGAPRLFEVSDAAGTLNFQDNTFWITNTVSGLTLFNLNGVGAATNTALIFAGNKVLGMSNAVADVRGVLAQNFADATVRGNTFGSVDVRSAARALIHANIIIATNSGRQINIQSVTNSVVSANIVRQLVSSSGSPIFINGAGTGSTVVDGNYVEANSSNPLILQQTSGALIARNNALVNAGAGGTEPGANSGATLETLPVGRGGTGAATLTGPVKGNGTGAFTAGAIDLSGAEATGILAAARAPAHTGDATSSAGSLALTLASVGTAGTYTKVTTDVKGRVASGTTLAASDYPVMIGDAGSGGTRGAVPAPAAGDATKFLRGDATYATPPGGSPGGSDGQVQFNSAGAFAANSGLTYAAAGASVATNLTVGRQLILPTGSASQPASGFNGETNTGPYRRVANTYGFSINGVGQMEINASGQIIGIGSVYPVLATPAGTSWVGVDANGVNLRNSNGRSILFNFLNKMYPNGGAVDLTGWNVISGLNGVMAGSRFTSTADATVANTTTETSAIGTGAGTKPIAAGELAAGRTLPIVVRGYVSSTGSPTVTWKLKLGSNVVLTSPAVTLSAVSNVGWKLMGDITCRTTGASGTVVATCVLIVNGTPYNVVQTGTTTVNTTTSLDPDVTVTWSVANAANSLVGQTAVVNQLN